MMLRDRLKLAESNARILRTMLARFAHVVEAAKAFVEQQSPLDRGDFAAPAFDELKRAVRQLLPPIGAPTSAPTTGPGEGG